MRGRTLLLSRSAKTTAIVAHPLGRFPRALSSHTPAPLLTPASSLPSHPLLLLVTTSFATSDHCHPGAPPQGRPATALVERDPPLDGPPDRLPLHPQRVAGHLSHRAALGGLGLRLRRAAGGSGDRGTRAGGLPVLEVAHGRQPLHAPAGELLTLGSGVLV